MYAPQSTAGSVDEYGYAPQSNDDRTNDNAQPFWQDLGQSIGGAVSSATDFVGDTIEAGIDTVGGAFETVTGGAADVVDSIGEAGSKIVGAGFGGASNVVQQYGDAAEDVATAAAKPFAVAFTVIGIGGILAFLALKK